MDKVVQYVNGKFKGAGHSKEVRNQKEELISGLHDRINDEMVHGKSEEEALRDAVASLDGLEELTEALHGKRRTVYVNRLNFHHSLLAFGIIALAILACGVTIRMDYQPVLQARMLRMQAGLDPAYFDLQPMYSMFMWLKIALFTTATWPVACSIVRLANPAKTQQIAFNFRKSLTIALVGWLAISLLLFTVNAGYPPHYDTNIMSLLHVPFTPWVLGPIDIGIGVIFWFIYPVIVIFTWPISILIYNLLFKNKRYLVKQ